MDSIFCVGIWRIFFRVMLPLCLTCTRSPFGNSSSRLVLVVQAYELFSHEADTGMVIPAASRLKNVQWHTQTVLFGWASQGVWPPELDGTEVMTDMPFMNLFDPGAMNSRAFGCFKHCFRGPELDARGSESMR